MQWQRDREIIKQEQERDKREKKKVIKVQTSISLVNNS